jgi:hypothetical protein
MTRKSHGRDHEPTSDGVAVDRRHQRFGELEHGEIQRREFRQEPGEIGG